MDEHGSDKNGADERSAAAGSSALGIEEQSHGGPLDPTLNDYWLYFERGTLFLMHIISRERVGLSGHTENSVCLRSKAQDSRQEVTAYLEYRGDSQIKVILAGGSLRKSATDPKRYRSAVVVLPHIVADSWDPMPDKAGASA
jgi:hypothetical protein